MSVLQEKEMLQRLLQMLKVQPANMQHNAHADIVPQKDIESEEEGESDTYHSSNQSEEVSDEDIKAEQFSQISESDSGFFTDVTDSLLGSEYSAPLSARNRKPRRYLSPRHKHRPRSLYNQISMAPHSDVPKKEYESATVGFIIPEKKKKKRKNDPVRAHQKYSKEWRSDEFLTGESENKARSKTRRQMTAMKEDALWEEEEFREELRKRNNEVRKVNDYVIPSDNRRDQLRWETRYRMAQIYD
ncbi:hypothetical protein PCE1_000961 [Barthelona sp. PCE]